MQKRGIVYVASLQPHYVQEAFLSAASIKLRFPHLPITLFTDSPESPLCGLGMFDDVRVLTPISGVSSSWAAGQLNRLTCLPRTPYEHTLHLDTDTRFLAGEIDELFATPADVAMVEDAAERSTARKLSGRAMFNGGLVLYRHNERVWSWLESWRAATARNFYLAEQTPVPRPPELAHIESDEVRRTLLRIDQISLMEILSPDVNRCGLTLQILDYAWNHRGPNKDAPTTQAKIAHLAAFRRTVVDDLLRLAEALGKHGDAGRSGRLYDYVAGLQPAVPRRKRWLQRHDAAQPEAWASADLQRGDLHLRYGQVASAFEVFSRKAELTPDDPLLAAGLARVALEQNLIPDALTLSEAALAGAPSSAYVQTVRARALLAAARPEDAAATLRKSRACDTAEGGFQLGQAWLELRNYRKAAQSFMSALEIDPAYGPALQNAMPALLGARDYRKALIIADSILARQPWHVPALAFKCIALVETGRSEEARALIARDAFLETRKLATPEGFASMADFHRALGDAFLSQKNLVYEANTAHGGYHANLTESRDPVISALTRLILDAVEQRRAQLRFRSDHVFTRSAPRSYRFNAWAVLLEDGGYQSPHIHSRGWMSGVYYVDVPEEITPADPSRNGWIKFGRSEERWYRSGTATDDLEICPEPGLLVTFPSFYWHTTNPLKARGRRISYAFDVMPA